ncbi:DEAD/DEAH box helicase [Marinobacter caseinilyticus]|uniref:DEAD/DEAH box helicase n=1 Tax=Marinobacter caseinilyticus TaxID=2692195 RepID=UPI00140BFD28|nr:DEAD/DEAH box helicase [Marinobacter caseinilyticus]
MSFAALQLSEPLLDALEERGYTQPSPIQAQTIPGILEGRDMLAAAQTGTGKTASFALPILQRLSGGESARSNSVRALILTPTRELAAQVGSSVALYGRHLELRSEVVYGGVRINPQMMKLRKGVDILVATPGRLMDLFRQNAIKFDQLETLVLDEADRMLDLGFITDIRKILELLPEKRQNLLFSATLSADIRLLARGFMHHPLEVDVSPKQVSASTVQHSLHPVDKKRKGEMLSHLIRSKGWFQALVFVKTKKGADRLVRELYADGIGCTAIHGDRSQAMRTKALEDFKSGKIGILVATDVAARGLDIESLPLVVNMDLPKVAEDYVHRIGRTGRAGSKGRAVSLVSHDEVVELRAIERLLGKRIVRDNINGFDPEHNVPVSPDPTAKPKKVTKPKKPKRSKRPDGKLGAKRGPKKGGPSKAGKAGKPGVGKKPQKTGSSEPRPPRRTPPKPGNRPARSGPAKSEQ